MKWIIALITAMALNTALILWGRGNFLAIVLPLIASFWVGLPLFLLSAICLWIALQKKKKKLKAIAAWGIALSLTIFSTVGSMPVGCLVHKRDVRRTQKYCESLIPILEENKKETGAYPTTIDKVMAGREIPGVLLEWRYFSKGTDFRFDIHDNASIGFDTWTYESKKGHWHYWD